MQEVFYKRVEQVGLTRARREYGWAVLHCLTPFFAKRLRPVWDADTDKLLSKHPQPARTDMLRNYVKIARRNLLRNKVYSFINIGGLAVGMAVAMLIGLWIYNELSANKHHKSYETLYQVKLNQTFDGKRGTQDAVPYPLGDELRTKYPDFKAVAMYERGAASRSLVVGTQRFLKAGSYIGEEAIAMFSLNILNGDKNPLKEPYSIVLTDETARAIFGSQDPIGKTARMDNSVDIKSDSRSIQTTQQRYASV